jgi:bacterioferritin-associated ferredoxin
MIVCLCRVVTERSIKAAIADGATSVNDVAERTRAGTGCGSCRGEVHAMLEDAGIACEGGGKCEECPRRGFPDAAGYASMSLP